MNNLKFKIFKDLIWDNAVKYALTKLFAAVPFLGWGPIGSIITHYVFKFTDILYDLIKELINHNAIASKNVALQRRFDDAAVKLMLIADAFGEQSEEFRSADEEHMDKFSRYISYLGNAA